MAFDVTGLTNYVKENAKTIIAKQLTTAQTAEIIAKGGTVLTEVKSSEKIGSLETDAVFQDGAGCGFNASGSTKFSQRLITAAKIKVEEALCLPDLEAKYTQAMLTAGVRYDSPGDFDFNQFWIDRKIAQTAIALENAIWQGDTASADAQLQRFDGLVKLLHAVAGVTQANTNGHVPGGAALVAVDGTNIMKVFDAFFDAVPDAIADKPDLTVFVPNKWFKLLKLAIRNSNYFHYDVTKDLNTIYCPGSDLKIVRVSGLAGIEKAFATTVSNMVAATDLLDDQTNVKVYYDENTELVKYSNKFKYGVNVGFLEEVVEFAI